MKSVIVLRSLFEGGRNKKVRNNHTKQEHAIPRIDAYRSRLSSRVASD